MEDQKIVALFWQRDQQALRQTQTRYGAYLMKVAVNVLGDPEDSRECVNDAYLAAWEAIPPHRPGDLRAFLSKLTRRIAIDRLRKNRSAKRGGGEYDASLEELGECIPGGVSPQQLLEGKELARAVAAFLLTRSETARNAFLCRYFYMDPIQEVARSCGLTESNTKVLLHRTRKALGEYLQKEGYL